MKHQYTVQINLEQMPTNIDWRFLEGITKVAAMIKAKNTKKEIDQELKKYIRNPITETIIRDIKKAMKAGLITVTEKPISEILNQPIEINEN